MGWELRKGRWYLYRSRRVNGRPVKEYLAAEGDFGSVMAWDCHLSGEDGSSVELMSGGR